MIIELSTKGRSRQMKDNPNTPQVPNKLKVRRLAVFTSLAPGPTQVKAA
jgi:hypothetical protein